MTITPAQPEAARQAAEIQRRPQPEHWFEAEPLWFKTAVFYEIHLRGFYDGDGDGSGDFRGLTDKLDYLQWLGVDCIWLLPMYLSPLRDGGYDIADFFAVQDQLTGDHFDWRIGANYVRLDPAGNQTHILRVVR